MGVDTDCVPNLSIEGIDEHGLVETHNLRQDSDLHRALVGDRIVEVNGVRNDPDSMLHECKVKQRVVLLLMRTAGQQPRKAKEDLPAFMSVVSPPTRVLRPDAE